MGNCITLPDDLHKHGIHGVPSQMGCEKLLSI